MNLFLFTNFFPYKRAEPFLVNEFEFAVNRSETITVASLYGMPGDAVIRQHKKIALTEPVFELPGNKKIIWLKGIFNLAPFDIHVAELFRKGLFFKPKQLYWWIVSLFITRSALSSKAYKEIIHSVNASEKPVLYFYWGDNLCWTIPYLKRKIKNRNVKIILRLHGSDLYENMKSGYAPLREKVFAGSDRIFTVAKNGCDYLKEKYPQHATKMEVAPLGVFDNGLNITNERIFTVVSASNVVPLKRVSLIFQGLQQMNLPVQWHHFGDGPLFTELKELVKSKRSDLEINLHGHVSNKDLIQFYKSNSVDLFINVSTSEGLPVSIMEALSFGIPVMATSVGGTPELVNGSLGELLDPDVNPSILAGSMAHFFKLSLEERTIKRKNAREQFLEKASADKNYNNFYKLLSEL